MKYFYLISVLALSLSTPAGVLINEIHSNPDVDTDLVKFIELYNDSGTSIDLGGWKLTKAVDFIFPPGTTIAANGYLVIAENPTALQSKFGVSALGPWSGNLSSDGDDIVLLDASGAGINEVEYQAGFPWPTVGQAPGFSMELVNPAFDNTLGANWRPSVNADFIPSTPQTLVPIDQTWRYEQSGTNLGTSWQATTYSDGNWPSGAALLYYENANLPAPKNTLLSAFAQSKTTYYFRAHFSFSGDPTQTSLSMQTVLDDGAVIYLNGHELYRIAMPAGEVTYATFATRTVGDAAYEGPFPVPNTWLISGDNVLAVEVHQANLQSSDIVWGMTLSAIPTSGGAGQGPTPGAKNAAFGTNLPPAIRQVDNSPQQPKSGEPVQITAKITDTDGVQSVLLQYQLVDPGAYIGLGDPAFQTNWTSLPMNDAGANGDEKAGDDVFSVTLPGSLQTNRRLVRYRIIATDSGGRSVRVPYAEDAQPNFAYFVYDGVPSWRGAVHPGDPDQLKAQTATFDTNVMGRLPVYHLITKAQSVFESQFQEQGNSNDQFKWTGTVVYDGKVYDHISYRARGGVWRHAMGKNAWKWSFTHNHHFQMRDNYGHSYNSPHSKLNLRPIIQQGDYLHRGEQGMFEAVTLRMFNMLGVPGSRTTWFQFRVVDGAAEYGPTQYDGDLWGLYLAVEEGDGDFLKEHNLLDGNFYMMRDGFGGKQNQGRASTPDSSDLSTFINTYKGSPSTAWWRTNLDLQEYYSYRTVIEAVHHYDVDDPPGKNYEYYHNGLTGLWSVHPWDMDLTWADNMYGGGNEPFRDRVAQNANQPQLSIEYKNRIREARDLLFNPDQMGQLIDEYANLVHGPAGLSITDVDRAQWDYNPILVNSAYGVLPQKAGWGLFYQFPYEQPGISNSFYGAAQLMKRYVVNRMSRLDALATDANRPAKPTLMSLSPANSPINKLSFRSSGYSGTAAFAGMKWRVGEITPINVPEFDPFAERKYEIESAWESAELAAFASDFTFPSSVLKVGHVYRARVKMKDSSGRWSNWSGPVEFTAGEADNLIALSDNLRVTELMYNPPSGSDFEFIELHNVSSTETLDLSGVKFTQGIDYTFPTNSVLGPNAYLLVTHAPDVAAFRAFYNLDPSIAIYGPYQGSFNNAGETVTIKAAAGGADLISFLYSNNRGWSIAADGGGHSLVPRDSAVAAENRGSLNYGGNWRASALIKGSPGRADSLPQSGIVINEFAANTAYNDPAHPEYISNDWIELYNKGSVFENFDAMFLSDDVTQPKKWALPPGGLETGQRISFDEVSGFHSPTNTGFGLNSAGEQLVLSFLPGNSKDQIIDAFSFKAQEPGITQSRVPDGAPFWFSTQPTRNLTNGPPVQSAIISELMYHPKPTATQPEDNSADEFIELWNPTSTPINFFNSAGPWRMDGGIKFVFPADLTLGAGKTLLLVDFDPTNSVALNAFRQTYAVTNDVIILGPYNGKLSNSSDRLGLEKPHAPTVPGDSVASVIVDEVIYSNLAPWPETADASGLSIARVDLAASGNDPANWIATMPTPGTIGSITSETDGDHDGIPDDWEVAHGLNPNDPGDANLDSDNDGMTNIQEYFSGTDPRDPTSFLALHAEASGSNAVSLSFTGVKGKSYRIEYADDISSNNWTVLTVFDPSPQTLVIQMYDAPGTPRFYRLVTH